MYARRARTSTFKKSTFKNTFDADIHAVSLYDDDTIIIEYVNRDVYFFKWRTDEAVFAMRVPAHAIIPFIHGKLALPKIPCINKSDVEISDGKLYSVVPIIHNIFQPIYIDKYIYANSFLPSKLHVYSAVTKRLEYEYALDAPGWVPECSISDVLLLSNLSSMLYLSRGRRASITSIAEISAVCHVYVNPSRPLALIGAYASAMPLFSHVLCDFTASGRHTAARSTNYEALGGWLDEYRYTAIGDNLIVYDTRCPLSDSILVAANMDYCSVMCAGDAIITARGKHMSRFI